METMHFTIQINAPKEKVWDTMLGDATYREWTKAFHEGSYFEGDWSEGSKMRFLGPDENGKGDGGMLSMVKENRQYEFISLNHIGIVNDGVEDTTSDMVKQWAPSFENYTFVEKDGGTEVIVDAQIDKEYKEEFEKMWPVALAKLKEVAER